MLKSIKHFAIQESFLTSTPPEYDYFHSHFTHLQLLAAWQATSSSFPLQHKCRLPLNHPVLIIPWLSPQLHFSFCCLCRI
jgi:hypothetical protein